MGPAYLPCAKATDRVAARAPPPSVYICCVLAGTATVTRARAYTCMRAVFRNRLFRTESYNPFEEQRAPPPKRRPRRRKWRLDDSIWHARKLQGNSRSYYETHESMRTLFDTDWGMASVGIAKMVERADERGKQWLECAAAPPENRVLVCRALCGRGRMTWASHALVAPTTHTACDPPHGTPSATLHATPRTTSGPLPCLVHHGGC